MGDLPGPDAGAVDNSPLPHLGLGIGWRPELANLILRRPDLGFVEVLAESGPDRHDRDALDLLARRGVAVVVHGTGLGLGGADRPDHHRIGQLAALAEELGAPLVSEHAACVRSGRLEVGHLLPLHRTRDQLEVLVENVALAQAELPVPLAIEHVASVVDWTDHEMDEGTFLTELCDRTGCLLLLDVANLIVNCANHGGDPLRRIEEMPLDHLAYVHVAGGVRRGGLAHDTHLHPLWDEVDDLLVHLAALAEVPGVMLERDGAYPGDDALDRELDRIAVALTATRATP